MGPDAIENAAPLPAFSKDSAKKKRTNRLAKLKQSKLDVRREQWLSHVKNKNCNEMDSNALAGSPPPSTGEANKERRLLEKLRQLRMREDEHEILSRQDSELESLVSSSICSSFSHDGSGKDSPGSSTSSSGFCSGSVSEEEREEGSPDDWEAVADAALSADINQQTLNDEPPSKPEQMGSSDECKMASKNNGGSTVETNGSGRVPSLKGTICAWSPDDAFRPQDLPGILKKHSLQTDSAHCCSQGGKMLSWSTVCEPSTCPICCEDLDVTDSSFLPCPCGFHLCLFCHKRILEDDGRCPGCRKRYDS
ncbi:hypothetical protein Ancab_005799 [Ancistrocladus abbreviatus]